MKSDLDADINTLENAMTLLHRNLSKHRLWEQLMKDAGISIDRTGAIILQILSAHPPNKCRLHDIARYIGIEAPPVTRKVQQLEENGLLIRQQDDSDKRASVLALTPAGQALLDRLQAVKSAYWKQLLSNWPDAKRKTLVTLIQELSQHVAENAPAALKQSKTKEK